MSDQTPASSPRPDAFGPPLFRAAIRSVPEDFIVEELPGFSPDGQGEHLFLWVEKRGANTFWVAQQLARWAGVADHAVSWAGIKDRHALTRQMFSVHLPKRVRPPLEGLEHTDFRVLSEHWHGRKLPRGALRGNRFELILRQLEGDRAAIDARLEQVAARGVPNWFGEQRFGRDGGNIAAARAMFAGRRMPREKRSILLSAARSEIFNRILAERVRLDAWDSALPGEVFVLDGSNSVFGPEPFDATLAARLDAHDIHPGGALWGEGELRSQDQVRAIEEAVAAQLPELAAGLAAARLKQERRALRLPVRELRWQWLAADVLQLAFVLPPGCYATAVLDALGTVEDMARAS